MSRSSMLNMFSAYLAMPSSEGALALSNAIRIIDLSNVPIPRCIIPHYFNIILISLPLYLNFLPPIHWPLPLFGIQEPLCSSRRLGGALRLNK